MATQDSEFLKRLLETFKVEAQEHLDGLSSGFIELEKAPKGKQAELLETVFRRAHSLKGAARAVNLREIESVCQAMEGVLAGLKNRKIGPSAALFDLLQESIDALGKLLSPENSSSSSGESVASKELIQRLEEVLKSPPRPSEKEKGKSTPKKAKKREGGSAPTTPKAEARPLTADTIRVSAGKLDSVLLQAEELLTIKQTATQREAELRGLHEKLSLWVREWGRVRPLVRSLQTIDGENGHDRDRIAVEARVKRVMEFLEWNRDLMESLSSEVAVHIRSTQQDQRSFGGMLEGLLEDMKKVLMLPFSSLLEVFPRLIRDLSRQQGKEVELRTEGGEIEIDRRILEEIKDPLIHLVRNCLDHGIEKPQDRKRKGKPRQGTVRVVVSPRDSREVEVFISDDGAGIDAERVKSTAVKLGLLREEEVKKLAEAEALSLIFHSGLSTSSIITDISGRGLGLAIVREKVERLGGSVSVQSKAGKETTFRIVLPLTLATFRGVSLKVGDRLFVVPTTNVDRLVHVAAADRKTVENRETIAMNGQAVALVRMSELLGIPEGKNGKEDSEKYPAVVLTDGSKRIAFLVDAVLNEQEVLVKSLGKQLSRVRHIAGATVLGAHTVVPILNVRDLLQTAESDRMVGTVPAVGPVKKAEKERRKILVVEDSITSRSLLKNILESAGYGVETAVDGIDGFTKLRSGHFDIVISDVDMPRMNGFGLTAKIRADRKFVDLPIILVTALESREDRERGIDVGANAYIVKSSFDQSNLLEVVQRLI